MSTSAQLVTQALRPPAGVRVEHITMESDTVTVTSAATAARRVALHRVRVTSPFHGLFSELSILEGHYLGVRCLRPGTPAVDYEVDLRFARPEPVRVHRTPWLWLAAALALATLGAGAIAWSWRSGPVAPDAPFFAGLLASAAAALVLFAAARRATSSLEIRSLHGDITLASATAGIGRLRVDGAFLAELRRHTEDARRARPGAKQTFLCDEMREHHRLHGLGVLGRDEYQAGKTRILAAHAPAGASPADRRDRPAAAGS